MKKEFWKNWKNVTKQEKKAILALGKAKKALFKTIPKENVVAIYAKGSFVRREMLPKSDVDVVVVVKQNKHINKIISLDKKQGSSYRPVELLPLSVSELKNKKRSNFRKEKGPKGPPNINLYLDHHLIYGKNLSYVLHAPENPLKRFTGLIKAFKDVFLPLYEKKQFDFQQLIKQVFWLTNFEKRVNGKIPPNTWKELAKSVSNKNHIVHDSLKYRLKPTKDNKKKADFIAKLKRHIKHLEKNHIKSFEFKIKCYFEQLKPSSLGCKKPIKVLSVNKLGMGTGNLNYVVKANKKKFIFRLNMDPKNKKKSPYEFNALKTVEKKKICPKAWLMDTSKKFFSSDFLIISYIEGKTVNTLKSYLDKKMIQELGTLLGRMHSTKITTQQKKTLYDESNRGNYLKVIQKRITYIKTHIKNKRVLTLLDKWIQQLKKEIKKEKKVSVVLTQGDFCEQNIIYSKGKYTLIDFEDLHITDPAVDIARVFIDFGRPFTKEERNIFFKAYLKITKNKDESLLTRANNFIPLQYLDLLSWVIEHSLKIKNKEMDIEFLKENDLSEEIAYAALVLKRGISEGVIDKKYKDLDFDKIIKQTGDNTK